MADIGDTHGEEEGRREVGRHKRSFPATRAELQALRKRHRSLIDIAEDVNEALVEDPSYRAYNEAVSNAEAVEGAIGDDDVMMAAMVREYARKNDIPEFARATTRQIRHAMGAAQRRYGISRKQRINGAGGEPELDLGPEPEQ